MSASWQWNHHSSPLWVIGQIQYPFIYTQHGYYYYNLNMHNNASYDDVYFKEKEKTKPFLEVLSRSCEI